MLEDGRTVTRIDLIARRQADLDQGYPDYHVYAGAQLVGRIYQMDAMQWFWGINTVMIDATAGAGMSGYAASLEEAQTRFRPAFDRWLALAVAIPLSDLKRAVIDRNLKAIGLR